MPISQRKLLISMFSPPLFPVDPSTLANLSAPLHSMVSHNHPRVTTPRDSHRDRERFYGWGGETNNGAKKADADVGV